MFESAFNILNNIKKLDINLALEKIFKDANLQNDILDLNKNQLYEQGVFSDGVPTGDYAPSTKYYYKPKAAREGRDGRTDHVTLKDTGELYNSFKLESFNGGIRIHAEDSNNLSERFGDNIAGLTNESVQKVVEYIKEPLFDYIKMEVKK